MKIIYNNWFPFGSYSTFNFFGILITKSKYLSSRIINHEAIHTAQMKEMLWVFFYIWYGIEYLIVRCFNKTQIKGYYDISFEEEAYINENNLEYLKNRNSYIWLKYIKIRSNFK